MKLKLIAAASCLALASVANAAINPGSDSSEGGELILSVWDDASSTSYTLDLGVMTREFDSAGTYTYDLSNDENWLTFSAGAESITWDVVGADRDVAKPSTNGIMTTAGVGTDTSVEGLQHGAFNTLQTNIEGYQQILDGTTNTDWATNESYFLSGGEYAGDTGTWGSFAGNVDWAKGEEGESLEFWSLTTGGTGRSPYAIHEKLAGTWTLSGDQLIYTAAAPVPVPAAVWLFGSALAGLVGVSRRKRS